MRRRRIVWSRRWEYIRGDAAEIHFRTRVKNMFMYRVIDAKVMRDGSVI